MTKEPVDTVQKWPTKDAKAPEDERSSFHPWEQETIVVNGQPTTITFPPDED